MRLWGQRSFYGLIIAVILLAVDQAYKYWMLEIYDIATRQPVEITSFFNLYLVWNKGISYGFLNKAGPWLLIALQGSIAIFLVLWLARCKSSIMATATGMVIGGALGNITDRITHGAVADFFHFHWGSFSWYVFNIADIAIVAGAAILVYDSFIASKDD